MRRGASSAAAQGLRLEMVVFEIVFSGLFSSLWMRRSWTSSAGSGEGMFTIWISSLVDRVVRGSLLGLTDVEVAFRRLSGEESEAGRTNDFGFFLGDLLERRPDGGLGGGSKPSWVGVEGSLGSPSGVYSGEWRDLLAGVWGIVPF